jgi:cytochrome c553
MIAIQAKKTSRYVALGLVAFLSVQLAQADEAAGEKKAAVCTSCHGAKGISSSGQYPNLAAQQSAYIVAQLKAFKSGARVNAMMQSIVANLTDDDMENLGDFFASLPNDKVSTDKVSSEGKAKFGSCSGCHGAKAEGRGTFPKLSGQNPEYIAKQLHAFAKGEHKNSPMNSIAAGLSEEDIKALSNYLGSLK